MERPQAGDLQVPEAGAGRAREGQRPTGPVLPFDAEPSGRVQEPVVVRQAGEAVPPVDDAVEHSRTAPMDGHAHPQRQAFADAVACLDRERPMLTVDEVREIALGSANAPVAPPVDRDAEVGRPAREGIGRQGRERQAVLRQQPLLADVERSAAGGRLGGRRPREAAHGERRGETDAARVHDAPRSA
jgi:hypothetical protein